MSGSQAWKILLVEDDFLVAQNEETALQAFGYETVGASTGEEAVAAIEADGAIDLVLMDMELGPGIDGSVAAARIQAIRDLPIVFLSSHVEPEVVTRTDSVPSYGYVVKEAGMSVLDANIKMALRLFETRLAERRRSQALEGSEERSRLIIDQLRDGIAVTDTEGLIVSWNRSLERILDIEKEKAIGRPLWDLQWELTPEELKKTGTASTLRAYIRNILKLKNYSAETKEAYVRSPDGGVKYLETSFSLIQAGQEKIIVSAFRDISKRKQFEIALSKSEFKYRSYVDNASYAIFVVDGVGRFLDANRATSELSGYSKGELLAMAAQDLITGVEGDEGIAFIQTVLRQGGNRDQVRIRHKGGAIRWVLVDGIKLDESSVLAIASDISEDVDRKEEIQKLLGEKDLILREVHHRIKNNMNTMKSMVYLQQKSLTDSSAIEALKDVENRFTSMSILYERLYQGSNFSALSIRSFLPPLVEEILRGFPRGGSIQASFSLDDFMLEATTLQALGIIVNELVTNIMKYAFAERPTGTIAIGAKLEGGRVSLTIQDDGVGMPENIRIGESPGFGLMLIDQLTQQLDGSLRIERGQGTRVVLEFDIQPRD